MNNYQIYKNGEEIELLSSKRLIQDELNDILGGFIYKSKSSSMISQRPEN